MVSKIYLPLYIIYMYNKFGSQLKQKQISFFKSRDRLSPQHSFQIPLAEKTGNRCGENLEN